MNRPLNTCLDRQGNEFIMGRQPQFYEHNILVSLDGSVFYTVTIWVDRLLCPPSMPTTKRRFLVVTGNTSLISASNDDDNWSTSHIYPQILNTGDRVAGSACPILKTTNRGFMRNESSLCNRKPKNIRLSLIRLATKLSSRFV